MKYLQKSFSTGANSQAYRDNFDAVFGKKLSSKCARCEKTIEGDDGCIGSDGVYCSCECGINALRERVSKQDVTK